MNTAIYQFALWLDGQSWSTMLHESYYMYNWMETTHVLTLMVSLGMLFLIDLRMLGIAMPGVPGQRIANGLGWPMAIGFAVMFITGMLLFYAIPVRSAQSLWFRIKVVLLVLAALNALLFHRQLSGASGRWSGEGKAPAKLRIGAGLSLLFWTGIVICGRLIAYDWFDCARNPPPFIASLAGCLADQTQF
jgi:Family of unknown function (DUF6644)